MRLLYGFGVVVVSVGLTVILLVNRFPQNLAINSWHGDGQVWLSPGKAVPVQELIRGPLVQNDSRILAHILQEGLIHPPSEKDYNLTQKEDTADPSMGQSEIVRKIFGDMPNGFFIECGALDGETRSNTLYLEKNLGWKGLLIEGDPKNFELMKSKQRKSWSASCCLAIHPYPHQVSYKQSYNVGKIKLEDSGEQKGHSPKDGTVEVQCFPLFSLLSAMKVDTIDYFSLDVEGFELDVLKTIPFHLVNIKVLTVEFTHGKGGTESLISFMKTKDYVAVTKLTHANRLANDVVFVRKDVPISVNFPAVIQSERRASILKNV